MADEYVKPKPPARTLSLHELRNVVRANDKFAVARKTDEEGIKLIVENYGTDPGSAQIFVDWIKGNPSGDDPEQKPRMPQASPLERLRKGCDPETGRESYLDENEKPEAKGKKKK